ncbi:DUF4331 domain-containing protein [Bizionia argentinensis JUB59]|uniref:DUF4331 domain-containing protein n=1 Tax=Bizionia argentinensis JUB59 TaxID=1046627 RepID=G2EBE6_9FLAO|nr:DUF4331 family protein [Bizionia argentinensis]EGV44472.1 DUF4331 domain-containing protein [Bizionia argentinensis JUB59]
MKNIKYIMSLVVLSAITLSCSNDDDFTPTPGATGPDFSGVYTQQDQMGRPAVNTVFVSGASKNMFNKTIPSQQSSAFQAMFQANLEGLSPAYANPGDTNALGLTSAEFTGLLATDVLNVSLDGTTTFFDGTNVLTGRNLTDDVITVELILIFGGEAGLTNPEFPGLSNDNVDGNDKAFLTGFPYLASAW